MNSMMVLDALLFSCPLLLANHDLRMVYLFSMKLIKSLQSVVFSCVTCIVILLHLFDLFAYHLEPYIFNK